MLVLTLHLISPLSSVTLILLLLMNVRAHIHAILCAHTQRVSASFALAAKFSDIKLILIAFLPASAFWLLDGYFLRQERLYRKLYDHVRKQQEDNIDFSMNAAIFTDSVDSWLRTCFSWTLFIFYGLIFFPISIIAIWIVFDLNQIIDGLLQ